MGSLMALGTVDESNRLQGLREVESGEKSPWGLPDVMGTVSDVVDKAQKGLSAENISLNTTDGLLDGPQGLLDNFTHGKMDALRNATHGKIEDLANLTDDLSGDLADILG